MSLILDFIFPRLCYQCHRPGSYLCPVCREKISSRSVRYSTSNRFSGCLSLFRYHQAIKGMLKDLKFHFISDLVECLVAFGAYRLQSRYPKLLHYWQTNGFVLVPIPLHPHRQNWRGFNQSDLLGRRLSELLNLPYLGNLLVKIRNTIPQTSIKNRSLRRHNISSSYQLNPQIVSIPKNIILFDDVYTTGSTLKSAATALPPTSDLWSLTIAG